MCRQRFPGAYVKHKANTNASIVNENLPVPD